MPPKSEKPAAGTPLVSETRAKLIEVARASWVSRLIDVSRRNNLLYFRPTPTNSIELASGSAAISELLAGKTVSAQSLLPDLTDRPGRVLSIARKAMENSEEKGLQTLYLALGFATWSIGDGGRNPKAPIFLLPLQMKKKGRDLTAIDVQVAGDPQVNPILRHILSDEFNIVITDEQLLSTILPESEADDLQGEDAPSLLERYNKVVSSLTVRVGKVPGFTVTFSAAISNFSFAKLALVNDLKAAEGLLTNNDVVAAIAGDEAARGKLGAAQVEINPGKLDSTPPEQEFCVVEADSSQQCAVKGIVAGQNAVVHGPPGTGKSQTITNLIATLVADGKTVLFVAEKRAALEVVQQRLERCGLDHLAMDLHGAELSSKKVMEGVARTLTLVRSSRPPQVETVHRQFVDRRNKLNCHDGRMHSVSDRTAMTVFDMQGALLRLPPSTGSSIRWRSAELAPITPQVAEKVKDLLKEAAPYEGLFLRKDPTPWFHGLFKKREDAQSAIDATQRFAHETLPLLLARLEEMSSATGFFPPNTFYGIEEVINFLSKVSVSLKRYNASVLSMDFSELLRELDEVKVGGLKGIWLSWTSSTFKAVRKKVSALRNGTTVSLSQYWTELAEIKSLQDDWRERASGRTELLPYSDLTSLETCAVSTKRDAVSLQQTVGKLGWDKLTFAQLAAEVQVFASDLTSPYRIVQLAQIEAKLKALGVQRLMDDLRQRKEPCSYWAPTFDYVWLSSALEELAIKQSEVGEFVGATHNTYVDEFKKLDSERLRLSKDRVRRLHAEKTIAVMNAHPEQESLIRSEAARTRCHKPLRKIFQEAGEVMTAVCPCWMASPLSVAQFIHPDVQFDFVIFDEASQILPEDAIPAIMRGKYVVVAGDNKQLPPTGFFAASIESEDEEAPADGFESLLDMMLPFAKSFHLNWHYRSKDEALIAFSNHHIYDDRLVTFPGPGGPPAITHELVNHIADGDGQEESSSAEVQRVVKLVLRHAEELPQKSLGVITMGIKHAMRVLGAIDQAQAKRPDLAEFFDPGRPDRFFVKNLERVQGDERDCIILSVGYGKDRAGNLPLRFGPILTASGRRRLNVAITRARETMTLVSSFAHTDIDISKVREGSGLEFLRNYLQFASSGGKIFAHGELTDEPMNDFEADIYEALTSRGLKLVPQVGCSSFRIDFGVCHPTQPGRFILAIEADGATYHSSYTARDRDRLRQQMLENLGWTFHRIWSTDWFLHRNEEIARTVEAYERAVSTLGEPQSPVKSQLGSEFIPDGSLEVALTRGRSSMFPPIPNRTSITAYTPNELTSLYQWIASDGMLRTNDEIADEMFAALPFSRRGAKIEAALRDTIARCERTAARL